MRKSFSSTLILTAVCLALVAWYFGYEKKYKPQSVQAEEKSKQLVVLERDQIQELDFERMSNAPSDGVTPPANFKPEYESIKLRKVGNDWTIVSPIQDQADNPSVGSMISTLTTSKQDRVVDEKPKDLAQYGLKDPVVRIHLRKDSSDKKGEELLIGINTPVGFNCYAKLGSSEAVYRVPRTLRTSFDKSLKDLRNKAVIALVRGDITEVDITTPKDDFILKREENKDEWMLAREAIPADLNEWNRTYNGFLEAKAVEFPKMEGKSLKDFGLAKPRTKVTFVKKDKSKTTLLLGRAKEKDKEKSYAKVEGKDVVYEVTADLLDRAEHAPATYRSLALSKFNRYDVQRIKIERGSETIELVKDGPKWVFPTEPTVKINGPKVDTLLTKLQDLKIDKYLSDKTPKIGDKKFLSVRVYEKKANPAPPDPKNPKAETKPAEEERLVLTFAKPKGGQVTGERSDLSLPFSLKEKDFQVLNIAKQDFVQPEPKPAEQKPAENKPVDKASDSKATTEKKS